MSSPSDNIKPKVYKFASLTKLMKFDPSDPACDGMTFSVTVAGASKVQLQVYNKNTNTGTGFSFYLIDIIPWMKEALGEIRADISKDVLHREISASVPEYAIKPGRPKSGSFIISSDGEGPYIQVTVDNASLPKWRFKPIASTMFLQGDAKKVFSGNHRLAAWLDMTIETVTLVSNYVAAIEARTWTPPGEEIEIKPRVDETKGKKKVDDTFDDDVPF